MNKMTYVNNNMILVERYYCQHCNKYFATRRHFCFRDPANRSCQSCSHLDFDKEYDFQSESCFGMVLYCSKTGYTIYNYLLEETENELIGFEKYHNKKGYMCPHWETIREVNNDENNTQPFSTQPPNALPTLLRLH